jgi:hypothetical protein
MHGINSDVKFVPECLNASVGWLASTRTQTISKPGLVTAVTELCYGSTS